MEYFSLKRILNEKAQYNVIFGERSNGKTFAVQELGIKNYLSTKKQMCIIRRTEVDLTARNGKETFTHFVSNPTRGNLISEWTNNEWNTIEYYSKAWYLAKIDEKGKVVRDFMPFCYAFAISIQEHYKSTSYPAVTTILFDEFLTRNIYLQDEFILFENLLSTIIRDRTDVTIFMCGNTVNKYNPYFKEMGLDQANKMKAGDIQVYEFAVTNKNETLKVAVQFADSISKKGKASDLYFSFGNPRLKMITHGMWEIALYPHLPVKYKRSEVIGEFFIVWEDSVLHCEVVQSSELNSPFIYVHNITTPINEQMSPIVFQTDYNAKWNYRRKINKPSDEIGRRIWYLISNDKIFYQDNEIGEIMRNYLQWCNTK